MKKKLANVAELIMIIISIIILSIPSTITWKTEGTSLHWNDPSYESSMFSLITRSGFSTIITLGLFAACIFMCLLSVVDKKKRADGPVHTVLAIFLFVWVNLCISLNMKSIDIIVSNKFPTVLFEFLFVLVVAISFVKRSKFIVNDTEDETSITESAYTNADELKKYKILLDNGAITQEEFDAKKKQLLDL